MSDETAIEGGFAERFADLGSTLIADSAFRRGVALGAVDPGIGPLDAAATMAGPIVTVEANNDLATIIAAVHGAAAGDVIAIANRSPDVAVIGDLIGAEAVRRGLAGFVVEGRVRDSRRLVALGLPVFCRGQAVVGPLKVPAADRGVGAIGVPIQLGGATAEPGHWAFGDADGVVLVGAAELAKVFAAATAAARGEEALEEAIRGGTALGDAVDIGGFLAKREADPDASFGEHIAGTDWAI